jgi:DNA-binding MarR family transcriptional regulator
MAHPLISSERSKTFHAQPRFSIMYLLFLRRRVGFTELRKLLDLSPGNLDHHLRKLEEAGLVKNRRIISWRPLVIVEITNEGFESFREYAMHLKSMLDQIEPNM